MPFFRAIPHSLRALLRAPTFVAVVIVVLALGVAANTIIFTLVDELLLNPFPYRDPNQLVTIWQSNPALSGITAERIPAAWSNFDAWRTQSHSFQAMGAIQVNLEFNLTGFKTPEHLAAAEATPGFFQMLGVNASPGRAFLPEDGEPGSNPVALVTDAFVRKHFAQENPVGRRLLLNDSPYTIVGVLPKEFHLPAMSGGTIEYKPEVWLPLTTPTATNGPGMTVQRLRVVGRLKPGVSLSQAKEDVAAIMVRRVQEDPGLNQGYGVSLFSLYEENTDPDLRNELQLLLLAALVLLLLACISLAGLMLARTMVRRKNLAIMAALGAGRWPLITPILGESFLLAVPSAGLGLLLSYAGVHIISTLRLNDIHAPERLAINLHAFIFAACVSMLTVVIFGLVPAWIGANGNPSNALKSGPSERLPRSLAFPAFVILQIAAALSLAIVATLLIRSFQRVLAIDPGFQAQQVLTAHLVLPPQRYSTLQDQTRFCQQLQERLQAIPGVDSAALIDNMPLYAIRYGAFEIEGRPIRQRSAAPSADNALVTPNFFQTTGIALRQGRFFTQQEAEADPPNVVIINEALARQWWPGQDPVGSHIRELPLSGSPGPWQTIVGVVADVRQVNTETPARPELFLPAKAFSRMSVVVRTSMADPLSTSASLQQAVWDVDHDLPVSDVQTLEQIVSDFNSQRQFNMLLLSAFAGFSIVLMLVGMYGLVSSFISSRSRDIGIRLALGAQRGQVCLALLMPTIPPVIAGIVLGLLCSFLAKRLIASVLFNVSPLDPATYILTSLAILAVLVITNLVTTLRAARIDPASVLRDE